MINKALIFCFILIAPVWASNDILIKKNNWRISAIQYPNSDTWHPSYTSRWDLKEYIIKTGDKKSASYIKQSFKAQEIAVYSRLLAAIFGIVYIAADSTEEDHKLDESTFQNLTIGTLVTYMVFGAYSEYTLKKAIQSHNSTSAQISLKEGLFGEQMIGVSVTSSF